MPDDLTWRRRLAGDGLLCGRTLRPRLEGEITRPALLPDERAETLFLKVLRGEDAIERQQRFVDDLGAVLDLLLRLFRSLHRLLANLAASFVQPHWPDERRSLRRVVAGEMILQPRRRLRVDDLCVAEDLVAYRGQAGVVFVQLFARVDVIVVVVVLAVVVEPGLHSLGEVFVMVGRRVLALPATGRHRSVVSFFQPAVEGRIDVDHAAQMNVVRELVNQDVLGRIRIAGIAEQVLLAARAIRIGLRPAGPASPRVPIILGFEPRELRQVGRELVVSDDAQPRAALDHRRFHIRPLGQHQVDEIRRLLERVVVDLLRRDDRIAAGIDILLVKRIDLQYGWRRGDADIVRRCRSLPHDNQQQNESQRPEESQVHGRCP